MKLELTIEGAGVQVSLPSARSVIGRNSGCDVRLPDAAVSNHHAEITVNDNRCYIEDLHSTNGTYVNGQRVIRIELKDGDILQLGRQRLAVQFTAGEPRDCDTDSVSMKELPAVQAAHAAQKSSILRAVARATVSDETMRAVEQLEQSVRKRKPRTVELPIAILRLLTGPNSNQSVRLDRPTIELSTGHRSMAYVSRRPTGYFFIPASKNDVTRVNGITSQPPGRALFHRDVIDVAGIAMEFRFPDARGNSPRTESEAN